MEAQPICTYVYHIHKNHVFSLPGSYNLKQSFYNDLVLVSDRLGIDVHLSKLAVIKNEI